MRPRLRSAFVRFGPAAAWMALIFLLSAQPGLRVSNDPSVDGPIRHVAHVIVYAILTLLLLWGVGALSSGWRTRVALLAGLVLARRRSASERRRSAAG